MARPTQRRRTERVDAPTGEARPVQLQSDRRYYSAGGYDKNVRAARALENAFRQGTQTFLDIQTDNNIKGRDLARQQAAMGGERDPENKQAGYMREWDVMDAEFDFNLMKHELPEQLRGFNFEEKSEAQVQAFISDYMKNNFGGVEKLKGSAYAEELAPKMLELEALIIDQHRTIQLERIREEQRTKIYANAREQLRVAREADPAAMPDYQTLFDRTGTFFDGADKKTVFWESIYDLAIDSGDSSIIDNVPEVMNGVPTGISDPKLLDAHRAAKASADGVAARRAAENEAATKAQLKREVFDLQHLIYAKGRAGMDTSAELQRLKDNPEASFSDYSAALNFGQGQLTFAEARSPQFHQVSRLWERIYAGQGTLTDVLTAYDTGVLGSGPQAEDLLKSMMDETMSARSQNERANSPAVSAFRSELTDRYNPATAGMFAPLDQSMLHIRNGALSEYNDLVLVQGIDPAEAARQVREKFDKQVEGRVQNAQSQTAFELEVGAIPASSLKAVAAGDMSIMKLGRHTKYGIEDRILNLVDSGELTQAEAEELARLLN